MAKETTDKLRRVMEPRSVAIIGISEDERSIGGYVLANLERLGYEGEIHLVSRSSQTIRGRACLSSIEELPLGVDAAVLALPESALLPALPKLGKRDVGGAIVFAAGFAEAGVDGVAKQQLLSETCESAGLCLIGPNCMGLTNFTSGAGLTFDTILPAPKGPRGVAIVAQSGAMANNLREALVARGLPITLAVTTGNEARVHTEDFLEFCLSHKTTALIAVYVEQIRDARRFVELARAARQIGKPIVVFMIGKSLRARQSAQSHTGALTGDYATAKALLECEAVVVPQSLDEMVDVIPLLLHHPKPHAGGVAFVTGSGATKNIVLDLAEDLKLYFPPFQPSTVGRLGELLPSYAACENPLDYTTVAIKDPALMAQVIDCVSADENCACLIVAQVPGSLINQSDKALHMVPAVQRSRKPSALVILGDASPLEPSLAAALSMQGLISFRSLDRCMNAFGLHQSYARALSRAGSRWTTDAPAGLPSAHEAATLTLPEYLSKEILTAQGVRVPLGRLCRTFEDAVDVAAMLGFPLVLKAQAASLPHKSDVGGVILGIKDLSALELAWAKLHDSLSLKKPGLVLDGVLVEQMGAPGVELVVGAKRDANWGVVLLVGLGGVWIEALKDICILPGGATEEQIIWSLRSLRAAPLLDGIRGNAAINLSAVSQVVKALGDLMRDHEEIAEIDVNPLMAREDGAVALDALVVKFVSTGATHEA